MENKIKSKERYKQFAKELEEYTHSIDTKLSTETKSKVKKIVFSRLILNESLLYFSIIQFVFIFLGLMDDVIVNINEGIKAIAGVLGVDNPFLFPVNLTAFIAISVIIFFFCFGFVGYKYLRTPQTTNLISTRNSGAYFMLWDMVDAIKKRLEELEKK